MSAISATVVITGIDRTGDHGIVYGTVDGIPAQVEVWQSHINQLVGLPAKQLYCAQQLKLQVYPPGPVQITSLNGQINNV